MRERIGYSYRRRQSWIEPQTEDRLATLLFCEEEKKYRDRNIVKPSTNIENGRERITSLALDLRWKTTVNYQSQGFRIQECFLNFYRGTALLLKLSSFENISTLNRPKGNHPAEKCCPKENI